MKKAFSLILALLLLFSAGCADENPRSDDSGIFAPVATEPQYNEDTVLFSNQNRTDIDDDRYTVYNYNYKGELLSSADPGNIGFYAENGLAPALDPVTGLYGFVDKSGAFVIDPQWYLAAAFSSDGLALVAQKEDDQDYEKYGFINSKGKLVIPCTYDKASSFYSSGLAIFAVGEEKETAVDDDLDYRKKRISYKYGVIDTNGNTVIEPTHAGIGHIAGDYICCYDPPLSDNNDIALSVYDLSGALLYTQGMGVSDLDMQITSNAGLRLYTWIDGSDKPPKIEIFDGKKFVELSDVTGIKIESRRVATRPSGYGYGVVQGNETVIPFEYDYILQDGRFYIAIKYNNEYQTDQTLDIYNENFEKTASDLSYLYYSFVRSDSAGRYTALPSGYFEVATFDEDTREIRCGVIDYTGNIIVPIAFDAHIRLYTYEGFGGLFDLS